MKPSVGEEEKCRRYRNDLDGEDWDHIPLELRKEALFKERC